MAKVLNAKAIAQRDFFVNNYYLLIRARAGQHLRIGTDQSCKD
jgi:hypothetical protein